jgi:WD40 repeat protein
VRLWNLDTGSTINMTHHSNTVSCIICATLKRGEEFVLTGSFDGKVGIWDVRKKSTVRPHLVSMFEAHPHSEVLCLLYDEHKRTIITSGNDAVRNACVGCQGSP